MVDLKQNVQYVKGVGPAKAELLHKLGIDTLEDLITYFLWIRKIKRNTKIPYKMEHTRRNIWQNNIDRCIRVLYNRNA